jgi:hypothetical protein
MILNRSPRRPNLSRRATIGRGSPGGWRSNSKHWFIPVLLVLLATTALASNALAINGSIHPLAIEIDASANLFPTAAGSADWVKDSLANTDTPTLIDSIATGVNTTVGPEQTGAAAVGHWNGVRIVDGIAGNDQDIFLQGGKEDDVSTWNVGPGSVGSGKYDVTQAYLANNQTHLFFGMEKRTNNGTTAFDFEFNQSDPLGTYIPDRQEGDVLLTFELQGSGNTGSAVAHYYIWDGDSYNEQIPAPPSLLTTINNAAIPAAPWGFVSDQGDWVTGNLSRFQFAEASIALSALPGVNACGGFAYVQVRSRSSSTANSDLKDTTRIFRYDFGGPTAAASLSTNCDQQLIYDGSGSRDSGGGTNLSYSWVFTVSTGVTLTGGGVIVDPQNPNRYLASQSGGTTNVGLPAGVGSTSIQAELVVTELGTTCTSSVVLAPITVYRQLAATNVALIPDCDNTFGYSATASGGLGPFTFNWTIQKLVSGNWVTAYTFSDSPAGNTSSGTLDINNFAPPNNGDGTYRALVTITDSRSCQASGQSSAVDIANPLNASAVKTSASGTNLSVLLTGNAGNSFGTIGYQWQRETTPGSGVWNNIAGANSSTFNYSTFEADATPSQINFAIGSGSGSGNYFGKLYTVNLRVHVSRTLNGILCEDDSNAVTVKKVTAVDP